MQLTDIDYVCCVPAALELPCTVYKYRKVSKRLVQSLREGQIYLAKPESFNDPFEPERIFSGSAFSVELARTVHEAGVLCLCKSNDNLPMWSYYGDALKGLAIGYDMAHLVRSLAPVAPSPNDLSPRWRYVFGLDYRDDGLSLVKEVDLLRNDARTDNERQKMFATKATAFSHEDECRVVVQPSADSSPEYAWSGHGLYRYAPEAVREIVFGELMTESGRRAIMEVMVGREVSYFNAVRHKDSFKIRVEPVSSAGLLVG